MRMILSSTFSNSFFGGLATWAFITGGGLPVWAAVIAWGCFFHTGGNVNALRITIPGNCLGIFAAWIAGFLLIANPAAVPPPVWAGLVIFVVVFAMVFVAHQMAVRLGLTILVVPASFYGAAATFAYMLQTPGKLATSVLLSASLANPLIVLPISMIVGAFLGLATAWMTTTLAMAPKSAT